MELLNDVLSAALRDDDSGFFQQETNFNCELFMETPISLYITWHFLTGTLAIPVEQHASVALDHHLVL